MAYFSHEIARRLYLDVNNMGPAGTTFVAQLTPRLERASVSQLYITHAQNMFCSLKLLLVHDVVGGALDVRQRRSPVSFVAQNYLQNTSSVHWGMLGRLSPTTSNLNTVLRILTVALHS